MNSSIQPYRLGYMIDEQNATILQFCLEHLYSSLESQRFCYTYLNQEMRVVIAALHDVPFVLVPLNFTDWSLNGFTMSELRADTYDILMGVATITADRLASGIQFSHILTLSAAVLVSSSVRSSTYEPNVNVISERFPSPLLQIISVFFICVLLLYVVAARRKSSTSDSVFTFVREMMPGTNTDGFAYSNITLAFRIVVVTAIALSMVYEITYQAGLAQSLLVLMQVDDDKLAYDLLGDVASGRSKIVARIDSAFSSAFLTATHDPFSAVLQTAVADNPMLYEDNLKSVRSMIVNDGAVFIRPTLDQLQLVGDVNAPECFAYRITTAPTFNMEWLALAISPKLSSIRLGHIDDLISMRFHTITEAATDVRHSDVDCHHHFYPQPGNSLQYQHLTLNALSGCFWLLVFAAIIAVGSLMVECFLGRETQKTGSSTNLEKRTERRSKPVFMKLHTEGDRMKCSFEFAMHSKHSAKILRLFEELSTDVS